MKKATLIVWVIIIGFIALVIFQNQTFFLAKNTWRLNLGIFEEYLSPELPNAVLFLFFFFSGVVIAYLFNFSARFKAKRTIKKLNTSIASHGGELTKLKSEISTLKTSETPADNQADKDKINKDETLKITAENPADKTINNDAANETSIPADDTKEKSSEQKK